MLRKGIEAALHPAAGTKVQMGISEALAFYYKFSVIPLILLIASVLIVVSTVPAYAQQVKALGNSGDFFVPVIMALYLWLLIPLGLLIEALLYHLVGKLLGFFSGKYNNTLTAVMFSSLPVIGLLWLLVVPIVGDFVLFAVSIWSVYLISVGFSNQHKTTVLKGFLVWLVIFIIAIVLATSVAGALSNAYGNV